MKGPGLPGFRKQAGSGFYKSSGFNITTSNRSPMKQGEETGGSYDEKLQNALDEQRTEFSKLTAEEQTKVDWSAIVTKTKQQVKDSMTTTETSTYQEGELVKSHEPTGVPWERRWEELSDSKKGEFGNIQEFIRQGKAYNKGKETVIPVYRTTYDVDTDVKTHEKDVEWTNVGIEYSMVGINTGTVKHDANDGSWRYNISGAMGGELSGDDIANLVRDGKFKFEKGGKGRLLMSKDYHDNIYQPMVEMKRTGEANRKAWQEESHEFKVNAAKNLRKSLEEQGIKEKNILGETTKKWKEAYSAGTKQYKASRPDIWNSRGGTYGKNPPWMDGDPNYGGIQIGIYNDDEVLRGTTDPDLIHTAAFSNHGGKRNLQGDRPLDWTLDATTGKYVLKEGAKTLSVDAWNEMDKDEKKDHLKNSVINGMEYNKRIHGKIEKDDRASTPTPTHALRREIDEGSLTHDDVIVEGSDEEFKITETTTNK